MTVRLQYPNILEIAVFLLNSELLMSQNNVYLRKKYMIKEVQYRNNFSYILNDNSLFLPTEYKILQNLEDNFFIKVMKMKFNGKIQSLWCLLILGKYKQNRIRRI